MDPEPRQESATVEGDLLALKREKGESERSWTMFGR